MSNNLRDKILIPAWDMIKDDSNAKKFYFIPWVLSIIFLTWTLVYQSIYTYVKIFWNNQDKILKSILKFLESDLWIKALIALVIFLIFYFILAPIFEAGLIKIIDIKYKWLQISKSEAFWQWLYRFLPTFEYNNIFSEFKMLSILNAYLFIIRFVWAEYISIINYIFLFILIFGIIINILLAYSKYFIVLENKTVFQAISESIKLTILNPLYTVKIFFMIFILNFRVIINFLVFLIFPIIIGSAITYISIQFILYIALFIVTWMFIIAILIMWYLASVLEIFKTSIWFHAYIYWKNNLNK